MRYTIAIEDSDNLIQISKLMFMKCGGFSLMCPYHNANTGVLSKYMIDYSQRNKLVKIINRDTYTTESKAKLSIHGDGFVQFSSANQGTIRSGIDEDGNYRGLGIKIPSLKNIIKTGPICGITIWGTHDFKECKSTKKDLFIFKDTDFNYRDCTEENWNGYLIEFTQFPLDYKKYIKIINDEQILMVKHFNYVETGKVFKHKVLPYDKSDFILGAICTRVKVDFDVSSGFILNSPSEMFEKDKGMTLIAIYPPDLELFDEIDQNLDYGS